MSQHEVNIVEIRNVEQHPDADRLDIVHIDGWNCIVRKGEFALGDRAIYVEPDYLVPVDNPAFAFLANEKLYDGKARIKVRKLRGFYSQGLLIPVPGHLAHFPVGSNVLDHLGIERYVPRPSRLDDPNRPIYRGFHCTPPKIVSPVYDLESLQRYFQVFEPGEPVIVTEKMHGTGFRAVYTKNRDGQDEMFVGSRRNWMKQEGEDVYWRAANCYPGIFDLCREHRDTIFFGEVFGWVQDLRYGANPGEIFLALFSAFNGQWLSIYDDHRATIPGKYGVKIVPILADIPFDLEKVRELAEGDSTWWGADCIREGVVITPVVERTHPKIGRVALKAVSNAYLGRG